MSTRRIAIGSRGSALALAQARLVSAALERGGSRTRVVIIETDGDRRLPDTAWGEGAFVAAIERALLDGRVDIAVHSAKDVPIEQDPRLHLGAYLPRADPRDALVVRSDATERCLDDLPPGTRVGTDSPRRTGFIRARRPDLIVHPLHGNVDTRLRRLDEGETDALVLACAGLDRLGLGARIAERLAPETVPPAPGQGAIAVQIRADDVRLAAAVEAIDDRATHVAVEAERAFLEASGGGCRAPIGASATIFGGDIELRAGRAEPDGTRTIFGERRGPIETARDLAIDLARDLRPVGAGTPTAGRRVLVTRAADGSDDLLVALRMAGLAPVLVPAISVAIEPEGSALDRAAEALFGYDWAVVSSANGARAILAAAGRVLTDLGNPRWAAIGAATQAVLEREGIEVAFRPSRSSGQAMASELPIREGERVLIVRGDLASASLADGLRRRGAVVDDVIGYRTTEAPMASRRLLEKALDEGPFDAVIFTSGSTARGLWSLAGPDTSGVATIPAVCIGPETAEEAERTGFRVLAIAPDQSVATLAATTASVLDRQPQEIS